MDDEWQEADARGLAALARLRGNGEGRTHRCDEHHARERFAAFHSIMLLSHRGMTFRRITVVTNSRSPRVTASGGASSHTAIGSDGAVIVPPNVRDEARAAAFAARRFPSRG